MAGSTDTVEIVFKAYTPLQSRTHKKREIFAQINPNSSINEPKTMVCSLFG